MILTLTLFISGSLSDHSQQNGHADSNGPVKNGNTELGLGVKRPTTNDSEVDSGHSTGMYVANVWN